MSLNTFAMICLLAPVLTIACLHLIFKMVVGEENVVDTITTLGGNKNE